MTVSAKSVGKLVDTQAPKLSLGTIERYQRAVNYLATAQVYLRGNALLEEPLRPEHIKSRLLGHWGTCPGINLIYSHLNHLILRTDASVLLITGPGHGAAANLANLYLEGTLTEFYPELTHDRRGLERLVRAFSWPDGFPSHLYPGVPGIIHEGGELGYALATAFGAALDNPELMVACIVGDGEAETGPTATAWHGNKFLNPRTDGAVLPILHLNDYKISSPSVFGTMSEEELESLFRGYGWAVRLVKLTEHINEECASAFLWAYEEIRRVQTDARRPSRNCPRWPMIILRTPKGWTGPKEIEGKVIEGSFRSHQVPAKDAATNPAHLEALERWLRSYRPQELFSKDGKPADDILAQCPCGERRMG
jgi:xylulose-5-phosphate/fructose-6-phosphate phosphoketolase